MPREGRLDGVTISDDDLCSECRYLDYCPGDWSHCKYGFPAEFDADGYAVSCEDFERIDHQGQNVSAADKE